MNLPLQTEPPVPIYATLQLLYSFDSCSNHCFRRVTPTTIYIDDVIHQTGVRNGCSSLHTSDITTHTNTSNQSAPVSPLLVAF